MDPLRTNHNHGRSRNNGDITHDSTPQIMKMETWQKNWQYKNIAQKHGVAYMRTCLWKLFVIP